MHSKIVASGFMLVALFMFLSGVVLAMVAQLELFEPGLQFISPSSYSNSIKYHGLFMLFGTVIPALIGFSIWYLPQSLSTKNIVVPEAGYFIWLIYVIGILFIFNGMFTDFQTDDFTGGWNNYGGSEQSAPSASRFVQTESGLLLTAFALLLILVSLVLTVLFKRGKELSLLQLPPLAWSVLMLATVTIVPLIIYLVSGLNELIFPLPEQLFEQRLLDEPGYLASTLLETPLLFTVLLFGLNLQVMMAVTESNIPRRVAAIMMVLMTVLFGTGWLISLGYESGVPVEPALYIVQTLMYALAAMVYVAGVILLIYTLARGRTRVGPHILFILFSYIFLLVAVYLAIMLALAPVDFQFHDTWVVNGYRHSALFGGVMFAIFGAVYALLLKWRTCLIANIFGYTHFTLTVLASLGLFGSYTILGLAGMPLSIADYPIIFQSYHSANTVITTVLLFAQLLFIASMVAALFGKKQDV